MRPTPAPIAQPETLYTTPQVIELLGLAEFNRPKRILDKLDKSGRLPAVRITQKIRRYRPADVAAFIAAAAAGRRSELNP